MKRRYQHSLDLPSSMRRSATRRALPRLRRWAVSALLLGVAGGCQLERARDLGRSLDEQSLPGVPNPPSDAPFGAPASDFTGRWIGTAEDPLALGGERGAYVFPSGSSAIRMEIEVDDRVRVDGRIVFGAGTPPSPTIDPDQGYPADVSYVGLGYFNLLPGGPTNYLGPLPPREGFGYRLLDAMYQSERGPGATVADGVLRLSYDSHEVLQPWCELQTPEPDSLGGHRCVGNDNFSFEDGQCSVEQNNLQEVLAGLSDEQIQAMSEEDWARIDERVVRELEPIDCDKLFLCVTERCACDESSCRANISDFLGVSGRRPSSPSYAELTLRKTEDGAGLIGVFNNAAFANERQLSVPVGVVHFERAD